MKLTVLTTALLLAATGALAAQPEEQPASAEQTASTAPAAPTDAVENEAPEEERKICRTEKATGSLTRRTRICMTQAQWREIYDRTRKGVGEMQGSGSGAPTCVSAQDVACGAPSAPAGF